MKRVRPITPHDSMLQLRFADPHDTWTNHDEAVRIAKRRWKRNRAKLLRRYGREAVRRAVTDPDQ